MYTYLVKVVSIWRKYPNNQIEISRFEFYLPMVFTVGAILMEKMAGLLERSLVAGILKFILLTFPFFLISLCVLIPFSSNRSNCSGGGHFTYDCPIYSFEHTNDTHDACPIRLI